MTKNCDKCEAEIVDSKCACGSWYKAGEEPNFLKTIERAIMAYDHYCEQRNSSDPLGANHYSGNCVVFFKGDEVVCEKVKEFIIKEQTTEMFEDKE